MIVIIKGKLDVHRFNKALIEIMDARKIKTQK